MNIWNDIFKPLIVGGANQVVNDNINAGQYAQPVQTSSGVLGVVRNFFTAQSSIVADGTTKTWLKKWWWALLIPAVGILLVLKFAKRKRY